MSDSDQGREDDMRYYCEKRQELEKLQKAFAKEYCVNRPLEVIEVDCGIILPNRNRRGGVLDKNGQMVECSRFTDEETLLWGGMYETSEDDIAFLDEEVIFIGQLQQHWGNFLFDCTARLWYALQEKTSFRLAYCSIDFDPQSFTNGSVYQQFLDLLGISPDRMLYIEQPMKFRKVWIPELAVFPGRFYAEEFLRVFQKMTDAVQEKSLPSYDRIYLTRSRMKNCKETGEKQVEQIFEENGFYVLAPETLPLAEQVYLLAHCRVLASVEGTTSHNVLFTKDLKEHIILRKQSGINTRQVLFEKMKGIDPFYIDVYREPYAGFPISHDAGPFLIGRTRSFCRWLEDAAPDWKAKKRRGAEWVFYFAVYTVKCIYYKYVLRY